MKTLEVILICSTILVLWMLFGPPKKNAHSPAGIFYGIFLSLGLSAGILSIMGLLLLIILGYLGFIR